MPSRAHSPWEEHPYRVLSNTAVTPVIRELVLAPVEASLQFRPGQYVLLEDGCNRLPPRSYSVANAPRPDGGITLLVTLVPDGPTSTWVHRALQPGDDVALSGPYGTFVTEPARTDPVLLLAAGSGLAPARALLESLAAQDPQRPVTLFFSARSRADLIDHPRFEQLAEEHVGFRYLVTLTREPGADGPRHVPELLADRVGDLSGWEVFTAGPPGFVTGCAAAAQALGAAATDVHTEEFFADPQPWTTVPELPKVPT